MNPSATPRTVQEIVSFCQELFDDLSFARAREWKAARPRRKGSEPPLVRYQ